MSLGEVRSRPSSDQLAGVGCKARAMVLSFVWDSAVVLYEAGGRRFVRRRWQVHSFEWSHARRHSLRWGRNGVRGDGEFDQPGEAAGRIRTRITNLIAWPPPRSCNTTRLQVVSLADTTREVAARLQATHITGLVVMKRTSAIGSVTQATEYPTVGSNIHRPPQVRGEQREGA